MRKFQAMQLLTVCQMAFAKWTNACRFSYLLMQQCEMTSSSSIAKMGWEDSLHNCLNTLQGRRKYAERY